MRFQSSGTFEYFKSNPANWAGVMSEVQRSGEEHVHLPVHWSVHESVKGIRDFSRSSKLRIEKALTCAEEAGLKVRVSTGFPSYLETTPLWARSNWEIASLVPSSRVFDRPLGNELTSLSSIHDFEFKSGWLGFLDELFSILSLYVHPEGPISCMEIDLDLFRVDQGVIRAPAFVDALAKRYRTIEQLNLKYRSSFRSFESACSSQGFRVMLDKRPWHAINDYKACRTKLLDDIVGEILRLPSAGHLKDAISIKPPATEIGVRAADPRAETAPWRIRVDGNFLDSWNTDEATNVFPCAPEGFLHPQTALALRVWQCVAADAERHEIPAGLVDDTDSAAGIGTGIEVFVCGRFLPARAVTAIQRFVGGGGHAIFPFGLPQFDETLNTIAWKTGAATNVSLIDVGAIVRNIGKGSIWVPSKLHEFNEGFFKELAAFVERVEAERLT